MTGLEVFCAAHDLQQPHHVRGREEVQADDRTRAAWSTLAISLTSRYEVLVARIAPCLTMRSSLPNTSFLTSMFSNTASMTRSQSASASSSQRAGQQAHALLDVLGLELAALGGGLVVLADHAEAAVERVLLRLDDRHRDADVGEVHRDAAAHGAGADDADLLDRDRRGVVRHVRNLPHLALGEEHVALRGRLRAGHQLHEQLALGRDAFVERQVHRRFDAADVVLGREEAAELARIGLAEVGEELRLAARGFDLLVHVAHFAQRPLLGDDFLREGDRAGAQLAFGHDLVEQARGVRGLRIDVRAGRDHLAAPARDRRCAAGAACRPRRAAGRDALPAGRTSPTARRRDSDSTTRSPGRRRAQCRESRRRRASANSRSCRRRRAGSAPAAACRTR